MSESSSPEDASQSPGAGQAEPTSHGESADRPHATSLEGGLTDAGVVLSKAVLGVARVLLRQGRHRARKVAESGRVRLDLRQLRRDRDAMYRKLGREVVHLVEGGEVDHPGLVRGVERIRDLDRTIAQAEEELARRQAAAARAGAQQAPGDQGLDSDGAAPAAASKPEDPKVDPTPV